MNRAARRADTERHIARQLRIARKAYGVAGRKVEEPHRLAKLTATNCGRKGCLYCQNPRRRGELTMQERHIAAVADELRAP
jgi:hypothetical protein